MKKPNFTNDNPALQFLSLNQKDESTNTAATVAEEKQDNQPEPAPSKGESVHNKESLQGKATTFEYQKKKRSTRSQRMQFVFTPETAAKIKARAAEEGTSVNDLINQLVEKFL